MSAKLNGTVRLAGVVRESIVDGPGIRLTVFMQGCPHHCPGCHNPQTHDPNGGYDCELQKILDAVEQNPMLRGITLSGGEPFEQAKELLPLVRAVIEMGRDVVAFSGYTFEQLIEKSKETPEIKEILSLCCMLVDGRFVMAERDLTLRFRGSRNQRLINAAESVNAGEVILSEL